MEVNKRTFKNEKEGIDIKTIKVFANAVYIKGKDNGYVSSGKVTDILLGKICQQLEKLIGGLNLYE